MQTVKRRCAQTAHISLHSFNFQRARTQNKQHTRTSGVLPSCIQNFVTSVSTRAPFRPSASLRLFVFGEALSREGCRCPQEGKTPVVVFFLHFLIYSQNLGVGGIFTIKHPRLAQDSFCAAARVRRFVGLFSAILPSGRSEAPRRLPSIAPIPPCRPCRS